MNQGGNLLNTNVSTIPAFSVTMRSSYCSMSKLMRKLLVTQGLAGPNGNGVINVLDITVGEADVSQLQ